MGILETKSIKKTRNSIRNSYYDITKPYTQSELDEYRISEGYSRERLFNFIPTTQKENNKCKRLTR